MDNRRRVHLIVDLCLGTWFTVVMLLVALARPNLGLPSAVLAALYWIWIAYDWLSSKN